MSVMELGGEPLNDSCQVGIARVRLGHIYPVGEVCYLVVVKMMVVVVRMRVVVVRMMVAVVMMLKKMISMIN